MLEIGLLIVGVAIHWIGRLHEIRMDEGALPNVWEAFKSKPFHVVKTTLLAIAVGIVLYDLGQLNAASALMLGISADRAADWLKRKVKP